MAQKSSTFPDYELIIRDMVQCWSYPYLSVFLKQKLTTKKGVSLMHGVSLRKKKKQIHITRESQMKDLLA